ncbi:MAG TPA: hypothetical protein VFA44_08280 [Gaiellaceae bacterium]|nr:hypothetical protein [Gaiellaceae bacterium]
MRVVHTVLGLLGVAVFIPCVIALAAGITWMVVRFSPAPGQETPETKPTA